jgi:D-alanyl-D-alanine dipeptidase
MDILKKHRLVDLSTLNATFHLDIRYATPNNFMGKVLYSHARAFLQEPVAHKLNRVQKELEKRALRLKIWDAYRPLSVQKMLWSEVPDERYVANPDTGSSHNRGAAIDLTLVDAQGNELFMPTGFDDFTDKAHSTYQDLEPEQLANREILHSCMVAEGFIPLETEWWHFNDSHAQDYPILDISFEEIA